MKYVLVVHRPEEWPASEIVTIVDRKTYLRSPEYGTKDSSLKVVNLSRNFGYQSLGYYVSLLAEARRHRVIPTAALSQDVKNRSFLDAIDGELSPALIRGLGNEGTAVMRIELGHTDRPELADLAAKLFRLLPIPIFDATFRERDGTLALSRIQPRGGAELDDDDRGRVLGRVEAFVQKRTRAARKRSYRFDLAILHDPDAAEAPSNPRALKRFVAAAESLEIRAELITREDYARVPEYDGLFIRETTAVNHHTYRFARRAQAEGIVVLDDPDSILRCTNKVFLAELLAGHGVPQPDTRIITTDELEEAAGSFTYPAVLKRPDGFFSIGSHKVRDRDEFVARAKQLLERSELILAQPFLRSDYDWRIGILEGEPLFACRYYMAKGHWQIIQHKGGRHIEGDHLTVPLFDVPARVLHAARAAAALIGDGLYGVDLKDVDAKSYVIEVNDNPNIDVGVEDQVEGPQLYRRVMEVFLARMERMRARRGGA